MPTNYFVDPAAGSDSTWNGTISTPWKSTQHALNTITRDSVNGDQVNIKSGGSDVLTASLTLATYGTPTSSAPLIFRGYTSTVNDGGTGDISGNSLYPIFAATYNYVACVNLHLHHSGSSNRVASLGVYASYLACEIDHGSDGLYGASGSYADDCYLHDIGAGGIAIRTDTAVSNTVNAGAGAIAILHNVRAEKNVITCSGACVGIEPNSAATEITRNSIYSSGGTGQGILTTGGNSLQVIVDNVIEGFSGTGGAGVSLGATAGCRAEGRNKVFNCATPYITSGVILVNLGADLTLGASPFTAPASGDLSLNSNPAGGTLCRAASWPGQLYGTTLTDCSDSGALQHHEQTTTPPTPTITVTVGGQQVVFNVAGSDPTSTNTVKVVSVSTDGNLTWTNEGNFTGDGAIVVNPFTPGRYLAVVESVIGILPAVVSNAAEFTVYAAASGIRSAVYSYLSANTAITAVVGTNIFPVKVPQGVSRPCLVYRRSKPGEAYDLAGSTGRAVARFRFDVVADTYSAADTVLTALGNAISAINRTQINNVLLYSATVPDDGNADEDDFEEPIDGGDTGVFTMTLFADIVFIETDQNP